MHDKILVQRDDKKYTHMGFPGGSVGKSLPVNAKIYTQYDRFKN